ncbi:NACHT, LRR and PYD domains-containing protein 3-like [Neolamprologus brichardi]|uniref:NACHT, LRR and PYD domains-containing protein 3-like n=1 Tax=Neolamprologus brichardi TaxID=32507 RepID=UPI001643BC68|nr:NACHT, LRR and PYD domains-containing protein 3-like [Neolamprologus brichardi]
MAPRMDALVLQFTTGFDQESETPKERKASRRTRASEETRTANCSSWDLPFKRTLTHVMIHLFPAYRQRLKLSKPVVRTKKLWSNEAVEKLCTCLKSTDWDAMKAASNSLDEFTDTVTSYIHFCEDSIVPSRTRLGHVIGERFDQLPDSLASKLDNRLSIDSRMSTMSLPAGDVVPGESARRHLFDDGVSILAGEDALWAFFITKSWKQRSISTAKRRDGEADSHKIIKTEKPDIRSQRKLKSQLKEQFTRACEGINRQKSSAVLNEIYTELYIIEGQSGEVNEQQETRQVLNAKFKPVKQETVIKYNEIFTSVGNKHIKTVMTIGVAGIGKTIASMKYMLDWAEGNAVQNIYFMFPFPFRELNLRREEQLSFEDLIHQFFPAMKTSEISDYDKYEILVVLDGFDECRLDLDFSESNKCTDVREQTSVNILLTNLIQGNLLPKAQIWITSRPAASNRIPVDKVDRVTEVRGFNEDQKKDYFRKRFKDKDLAEKILTHVKKSRSLYIMCHIPVFCWITAKVLEEYVTTNQDDEMPKTLPDMYTYFLLIECRQANRKYNEDKTSERCEIDKCWNERNKETIISLGKLAFEELVKGNFLFTEEKLTECGTDITKAAVFSGILTQIEREGPSLYPQKLFCFVHLSIQEFLAAFYVFYVFSNKSENLLTTPPSLMSDLPASDFYKKAVDKALDSKHGDWDLFLRFLLGLSLETSQKHLKELLIDNKKNSKKTNKETKKETAEYIKNKINEDISDADKNLNLFYCLNELNDHSLVKDIKEQLRSGKQNFEDCSAGQWSALTFVLLTSDEELDVFDLKKYRKSEKVLLGMLPVVKVSEITLLSWCELTEQSCSALTSSVLSSAFSNLSELDMSHNDLLDLGVKHLAVGLESPHCKLKILKLSGCQVTEKGCSFLASSLLSNTASRLEHLDLSYNHPGDIGTKRLTDINLCFFFSLDHCGAYRLKPGIKKYGRELKLDENTASKRLILEGDRKVRTVKKLEEKPARPENEDRFMRCQVLCVEGLKGLCYWEVEWSGTVGIAVAYKRVGRKLDSSGGLGCNEMSWALYCSRTKCTALHGKTSTQLKLPSSQKIAVLLDWEGGILSYYSVSSEKLSLIHTFHAKFTEPLFPAFWFKTGSVTLNHCG